ncbi:MAG: DNA methyltransferase [Thermoguttaceae bacterium]
MDILDQLHALCERLGVTVPPVPPPPVVVEPTPQPPVLYSPTPGIKCYRCDFRQLPLDDASLDAIITDIPWGNKWLKHVEAFAAWCAAKLKPGGIMATLYTAYNLDQLLPKLSKHLDYVWLCVSPMHGCVQSRTPFVTRCCTLCILYSKGVPDIHRSPQDLLPFSWKEKTKWHKHQQSLPVVQYLVEHFSRENALICDPCSGGWTTMEACWRTGRRFVGSDDNNSESRIMDCLDAARQRFAEMAAD